MSYYAKCSGAITLAVPTNTDITSFSFYDTFEWRNDGQRYLEGATKPVETFYNLSLYEVSNYDDDEMQDILDSIANTGLVCHGRLTFEGEDGERWRFIYDPSTCRWVQQVARLTWLPAK